MNRACGDSRGLGTAPHRSSTTGSDEFRVYSDDEIRPGLLPRRMPARTREGCGNTTGCYTNVFSEGDRWISFVVEPRS